LLFHNTEYVFVSIIINGYAIKALFYLTPGNFIWRPVLWLIFT
jgi:hypothetical protein